MFLANRITRPAELARQRFDLDGERWTVEPAMSS
jgi:hypothetical protein